MAIKQTRNRLWMSCAAALVAVVGSGIVVAQAGKTQRADTRQVAVRVNNAALNRQAGFPENAEHVNRTADGKLSWMMTPAEMRRKASFESKYLTPARKKVAASLTDGQQGVDAKLFGVSDDATEMISGLQFEGGLADTLLTRGSNGDISCLVTSLATDFMAQLKLPSGARVTRMIAYGFDGSLIDDTDVYLDQVCFGGVNNGSGTAPQVHITSGFTGGTYAVASETSDLVIDNSDCVYVVRAQTSDTLLCSAANRLSAVAIKWKRQVSPDLPYSTFIDVPPGAPFHASIEALVASGITAGCGNDKFCPQNPVTRGQMAAFLSRALGLHWPDN